MLKKFITIFILGLILAGCNNSTTSQSTNNSSSSNSSTSSSTNEENHPPVFTLNPSFKTTYYKGETEPGWIEAVTVNDIEDGEIILLMTNVNNDSADMNSVGTFDIIFTVTDSQGETVSYTLTITIVEEITYEITFHTEGGNNIPKMVSHEGDWLTLPTPEKEGHYFVGWYQDNGLTQVFSETTMPNRNLDLYAKWSVNSYFIRLNVNGGEPLNDMELEYGSPITMPIPIREGYTFIGWYSDAELEIPFAYQFMEAKELYAYAKWEEVLTLDDLFIFERIYDIYKITMYKGTGNVVTIPSYYNGLPVTIIGEGAFENSDVTDVIFPSDTNIETIANWAFKNSHLTSIIIPDTVTYIEYTAFTLANFLESIEVSVNNPYYLSRDGVLYSKDMLALLCYPANKADITFVLPEEVINVELYSLLYTPNLLNIYVETGNLYFTSKDGLLYNIGLNELYKYPTGRTQETYTIDNTTSAISSYAFYGSHYLKTINISNTVEFMGVEVFKNCDSLTTVNIEDNSILNAVNVGVFANTPLQEITIPATVLFINQSAFENTLLGRVTFEPNSQLLAIDKCAFKDVTTLGTITIPASVLSIGDGAFQGTTSLLEVLFEENSKLADIGNFSFNNSHIVNITIPSTITSIGSNAFSENDKLTSVTFDGLDLVYEISPAIFYDTPNLLSFTFTQDTPPTYSSLELVTMMRSTGDDFVIYVNESSLTLYVAYFNDDSLEIESLE